MPLPENNPWRNTPPTISDKVLFGAWIGASNLPVGSQTSTTYGKFNTNRNFLYKHNDTLVGFSDPPNNQSVTTYSRFDESGTQNIVSFFSEKVREKTNRKIVCLTGGQSATGLSNQLTGFDSPISLAQTEALIDAGVAKVGKPLDYAVLAVSDGDMRFNPTALQITSLITDYIANFRAIAGNIPIFIRGVGVPPTTTAISDLYPTWALTNSTLKTLDISGVVYVDTDSLTVATFREVDEIHGNIAGNKGCADLIISAMVTSGLLPRFD